MPKVVITPEMVDAGLDHLWEFDPDYGDPEQCVKRIFIAMFERLTSSAPTLARSRTLTASEHSCISI